MLTHPFSLYLLIWFAVVEPMGKLEFAKTKNWIGRLIRIPSHHLFEQSPIPSLSLSSLVFFTLVVEVCVLDGATWEELNDVDDHVFFTFVVVVCDHKRGYLGRFLYQGNIRIRRRVYFFIKKIRVLVHFLFVLFEHCCYLHWNLGFLFTLKVRVIITFWALLFS